MFQFRRFPAYAYLIQRTLHGYCPCGLPHSEIPGSMDICSSPRLIAACRVLRRLLMPRHSPCALYSLTWRRKKLRSTPFRPQPWAVGESSQRSVLPPFPRQTLCWFASDPGTTETRTRFFRLGQRKLGSLQNYAGFTDFGNCNRYPPRRKKLRSTPFRHQP